MLPYSLLSSFFDTKETSVISCFIYFLQARMRWQKFFWGEVPLNLNRWPLTSGVRYRVESFRLIGYCVPTSRKRERWEVCERLYGVFGHLISVHIDNIFDVGWLPDVSHDPVLHTIMWIRGMLHLWLFRERLYIWRLVRIRRLKGWVICVLNGNSRAAEYQLPIATVWEELAKPWHDP